MFFAQLVLKIDAILNFRVLKMTEAARLFTIRKHSVPKINRVEFRQFPFERLTRFLVALDQDVAIIVKPQPDGGRGTGSLCVLVA
jgi:predicted XRE-type DNA-binding protein